MMDYHQDDGFDVSDISDNNENTVRCYVDTRPPPTDDELAELDRQARENYNIKLFNVKTKIMYKPSLDTIYYNPADTYMTNIPAKLQLDVLLARYNNVRFLPHSLPLKLCPDFSNNRLQAMAL
jgi:hypothetical protein